MSKANGALLVVCGVLLGLLLGRTLLIEPSHAQ